MNGTGYFNLGAFKLSFNFITAAFCKQKAINNAKRSAIATFQEIPSAGMIMLEK